MSVIVVCASYFEHESLSKDIGMGLMSGKFRGKGKVKFKIMFTLIKSHGPHCRRTIFTFENEKLWKVKFGNSEARNEYGRGPVSW